jgi:hypothetical protein
MKRGIFLVAMILMGLFMVLPVMAQSIGPDWDYLRPGTNPTAAKTYDSLVCIGTAFDSSSIFYFNGLVPYGSIWVKMIAKASHESDSMAMPRIEYCLLGEDKTGKYHYKAEDTTAATKWDTTGATVAKNRWNLLKAQSYMATAAADTFTRVIKYDLRQYHPYGIRFRAACDSTKDSTLIKKIYITATKPTAGKTQLSY